MTLVRFAATIHEDDTPSHGAAKWCEPDSECRIQFNPSLDNVIGTIGVNTTYGANDDDDSKKSRSL
jgi:hypothetical protein